MHWTMSALIALVGFSGAFLIFGRLGQQIGTLPLLVWLLVPQALAAIGHMLATGAKPWVPVSIIPLLLGANVLCYCANFAQIHAIAKAPNPGFALAIIGANAGLVTLVAVCALGSPLGPGKLAGVALCLAGVTVVSLSR